MARPPARWDLRLEAFSRFGAIVVSCVGSAGLFGWLFGVPFLKSGLPGLATMKANTACALLGAGLSLWLFHSAAVGRRSARVGLLFAAAVFAIGFLTIIQDLSGVDLGIDQLLFLDDSNSPGVSHAGRMSPATATCLCLAGLALAFLRGSERIQQWVSWFAVLVNVIAALALVGYAYGVTSLYQVPPYASMAIQTAFAFWLLSLSLIAAVPALGFMKIVISETAGGFVARRLMLLIPVGLFGLGSACLAGEVAGWYDGRFSLGLMVLLSMAFCACIVLWHAGVLYRVDLKRAQVEAEIAALNAGLERKVRERTQELQTALDEVKQLSGLLPICAWCKKVRDDKDYWHSVEDFITAHTNAKFSHGMCPACYTKVLKEEPSAG